MKVCMVAPYFPPYYSGAGQQVHDFGSVLAAEGHEVRITALDMGGMAASERMNGMLVERVKPLGLGRLGRLAVPFQLAGHLWRRRARCPVVHIHGAYLPVFGSLPVIRRGGAKTALTFWDPLGDMPELIPQRRLGGLQMRLLAGVDRFVCVTSFVARSYEKAGFPPEKIVRIPAGIDTGDRFTPVPPEVKADLRAKKELPADTPIAVYTGSIIPRKGVDVLVEAWARVTARHPGALLLLVGPEDAVEYADQAGFPEQLKRRVAELGLERTVRFTGRSDRVEDYLQLADVFVFASRGETFGISVIEGMACGLPAVAACITDVSTDLIDSGTDGLLVPQEDPEAFAEAVIRLLDRPDEAWEIGRRAVDTVRREFSVESIARKHLEMYEGMLA